MAKRRMWLWGAVIIVALLAYLGGSRYYFHTVLHYEVLIEKSSSASYLVSVVKLDKKREDGWTPTSLTTKGPSSHE